MKENPELTKYLKHRFKPSGKPSKEKPHNWILYEEILTTEDDGTTHHYRNYCHRDRKTNKCYVIFYDNNELYDEDEIPYLLYVDYLEEAKELAEEKRNQNIQGEEQ